MAYRVLIVDDDPMVSDINKHYVETNNMFTVKALAKNGEEALKYLEKNKIDLVILDVFMPVMDGIETLVNIRNKKISAEVIMVTAANDTTTLNRTMHLGVLDYLVKPFTLERLQISLKKFINKYNVINRNTLFDQNDIDTFIANSFSADNEDLPKGIQKNTLEKIRGSFTLCNKWQSVDMISEKLGISVVTVRHYLNYLVVIKEIEESINYETGGHPLTLYKKRNKI